MINAKELVTQRDLLAIIEDFISKSSGLTLVRGGSIDEVFISQKNDAKKIPLKQNDLVDVLTRKDAEGREFVQVNFTTGRKILLTDQLIGFKPHALSELDVSKLPRVVTTSDLLSVFEAIEESISSTTTQPGQPVQNDETETLKRVFQSILLGGEEAGFDLTIERSWLRRLPVVTSKTSA